MVREEDIRPQGELVFVDEFEVRIFRKRIKNQWLRVSATDGHVEVSAPLSTPVSRVERFVKSKRAYILRRQQELRDSPTAQAERASEQEKRSWKQVVSSFVPLLVEKWAPLLGVRPTKVDYRNMRSRWGSCQPATGRICINTRLALYPPECLEYVVVHELCHLREAGHTPRFWATVEACLPDYRAAKELLRR